MANGISRLGRLKWVLGLVALTAGLPGCLAHARGEVVYDYPVTYVETVPARIEYYPSTYYRGRPAYLVEGRWYYRNRDRWVVFREEPVELREYRVRRGPAYVASPRRGYSEPGRVYAEPRSRGDGRQYVEKRRAVDRRSEARYLAERRAAERRAEERRDAARDAEARRDAARAADARRDAARAAEARRYRDAESRADAQRRSAEPRSNDRRRRDRRGNDERDDNERRRYQRE